MKKFFKVIVMLSSLAISLLCFTACDPVLPSENIKATCTPSLLTVGGSGVIEIIYPDTKDTAVEEWTTPVVEIIDGEDVIEVEGMSVTALKAGSATLSITVKGRCSFGGVIIDEPEFVAFLELVVE